MRKLPNVLNRDKIQKLISVIDEPWLMVAVILGLFCGLRRNEIVSIKVEHVDLSAKRLKIENSKNPNRGFEGYGKDRVVPIPDCIGGVLQKYVEMLGNKKEWLFPSVKRLNGPLDGQRLFSAYSEALKRAGLDQETNIDASGKRRRLYNFHTLRHTYATLLWEKTGDIVTVKHALGHVKLETTMIYTHVTNKVVEQKVNDAFSSKNNPRQVFAQGGSLDPIGVLMRRLALGEITMSVFKQIREELRKEQQSNTYIC